jgi:hypothetical protein
LVHFKITISNHHDNSSLGFAGERLFPQSTGIEWEGTFSQEPSEKLPNQMFYIDFYWTDTLNLPDVFWVCRDKIFEKGL